MRKIVYKKYEEKIEKNKNIQGIQYFLRTKNNKITSKNDLHNE